MTAPEPKGTPTSEDLRARLDEVILHELPQLDAGNVSREAGVSIEVTQRLWRALGFPDAGGEAVFTPSDVSALRKITDMGESGLDLDTLVRMTRALGSTMSRLADWEIGNLMSSFEQTHPGGSGLEERLQAAIDLADKIAPAFEDLIIYAWRRHLVAAVARTDALVPEIDESQVVATVGFADLVGFTSTTNELDEDEIGDLVEVFESRCADVVAARRARVIKSLGDSVLFVSDNAGDAVNIAWEIVGVIGGDQRLPDVRVGLATGPSVLRMGDVYGPAVNLAARLTTVARRNRVIVDGATASLLSVEEFDTRTLPARPIRGFGDISPVAVRRVRD